MRSDVGDLIVRAWSAPVTELERRVDGAGIGVMLALMATGVDDSWFGAVAVVIGGLFGAALAPAQPWPRAGRVVLPVAVLTVAVIAVLG